MFFVLIKKSSKSIHKQRQGPPHPPSNATSPPSPLQFKIYIVLNTACRGSNSYGQLAHISRRRTDDFNLVLGQVVADQQLIKVLASNENLVVVNTKTNKKTLNES